MPRRTIRLTDAIDERIESAAKLRGYSSPSAFLRAAIKKELDERVEGTRRSAEEKIVGSIREVRQDVRRVERAQQALIRFGGQLGEGLPHLCARAAWDGHGASPCGSAKPPRPAAQQCGPRDAQ